MNGTTAHGVVVRGGADDVELAAVLAALTVARVARPASPVPAATVAAGWSEPATHAIAAPRVASAPWAAYEPPRRPSRPGRTAPVPRRAAAPLTLPLPTLTRTAA